VRSFVDRVAAITGAASGIGRALALELAAERCHLALSDVDERGLAETARLAGEHGVRVGTARIDVARRDEVHRWADVVAREHGRVNLIFNNAGVGLGATIEAMSYDDFEWLMGIDFWGVVHGTKAFLPHLKASGDGHVVNVSSIFGLVGIPTQGAYNAAKFAVRGFTEALREELDIVGVAVSATCVHPGGVKTNIAQMARLDPSIGDVTGGDMDAARAGFERVALTTPRAAARKILRGVRRKARRVLVGGDAYVVDLMQRLMPARYQLLVAAFSRRMGR